MSQKADNGHGHGERVLDLMRALPKLSVAAQRPSQAVQANGV